MSQEIAGLCVAVRKAKVEPWFPYVGVTTSGGSFCGGIGSDIDSDGGRRVVDLQAVWRIENMGYGIAAKLGRAGSQLAQRRTELSDLREQIAAEVVQANEDVINYRHQIELTTDALALDESSFQRNLDRIRANEGCRLSYNKQSWPKQAGSGRVRRRWPTTIAPNHVCSMRPDSYSTVRLIQLGSPERLQSRTAV